MSNTLYFSQNTTLATEYRSFYAMERPLVWSKGYLDDNVISKVKIQSDEFEMSENTMNAQKINTIHHNIYSKDNQR